ncbi:unnamed protein product, partial [Dicrocoelium dendriticum]
KENCVIYQSHFTNLDVYLVYDGLLQNARVKILGWYEYPNHPILMFDSKNKQSAATIGAFYLSSHGKHHLIRQIIPIYLSYILVTQLTMI